MNQNVFQEFQWLNPTEATMTEGRLVIQAGAKTDFFRNTDVVSETGITPESLSNAPFLYKEVAGDFVMRVKVSHGFLDTYDAACIMVMRDLDVWAKACFEQTDFDTHAVVSVVTDHTSDDANGSNIDGNTVWMQLTRVKNSFSFHYSVDGEHFFMMRFFSLPVGETVKVGLLAQAPTGQGGARTYERFSLEQRTVKNIRMGN